MFFLIVAGIRRLSPDRQSSDDNLENPRSPSNGKKIVSARSVVDFQFNSMLEMEGVDKEMQENPE